MTFIIILHTFIGTYILRRKKKKKKMETIHQGHPHIYDEVYLYQSILPFLVMKRNILKLTKLTHNLYYCFKVIYIRNKNINLMHRGMN